jgi:hypothetical protein
VYVPEPPATVPPERVAVDPLHILGAEPLVLPDIAGLTLTTAEPERSAAIAVQLASDSAVTV